MDTEINITRDRVRDASGSKINAEIDELTEHNILYYSRQSKYTIQDRLLALEKEWDVERTLELNAAILGFAGIFLSVTVNKKWLILPALITVFLARHALEGWSPSLPLLRKMYVRTRKEIDREKYALIDALKNKV